MRSGHIPRGIPEVRTFLLYVNTPVAHIRGLVEKVDVGGDSGCRWARIGV